MWLLVLLLSQAPPTESYGLYANSNKLPPGPTPVFAVAPVFPKGLVTGQQGEAVVVEVQVGGQGLIENATTVECKAPRACSSALKAVTSWRFEPGSRATVKLVFVYRSMPHSTSPEGLATIFRNKYEIEVRCAREQAE